MTLLHNAVSSIQLGLEDFEMDDDRRLLSAVRNLHSGILLLFKEKLERLSPADSQSLLVMKKSEPFRRTDGTIVMVGAGRTTVDQTEIQSRFGSLGVHTDWRRVSQLSDLRNDIEHRYTAATRDSIRSAISNTFLIVRDFLEDELQSDAREVLGAKTWSVLMEIAEVYETEHSACLELFMRLPLSSPILQAALRRAECTACGSGLVAPSPESSDIENGFAICRSCSRREYIRKHMERALVRHLGRWDSGRDSEVLITCPRCFFDSYIIAEQICALCGHECVHTCESCQCSMPPSDVGEGSYCGWCLHMEGKRD
jgi:hypothetical protein